MTSRDFAFLTSILFIPALVLLATKDAGWLVRDASGKTIVNLKRLHNTTVSFVQADNNLWSNILKLAHLPTSDKSKRAIAVPINQRMIVENMQLMKQQSNLDIDFFLVPETLFHQITQHTTAPIDVHINNRTVQINNR